MVFTTLPSLSAHRTNLPPAGTDSAWIQTLSAVDAAPATGTSVDLSSLFHATVGAAFSAPSLVATQTLTALASVASRQMRTDQPAASEVPTSRVTRAVSA